MSLASSAALSFACVPATAQLLLPTNGVVVQRTDDGGSRAKPPCARRPPRRSKTSGPGIGAARHVPPTTGASHSVPSGCRKANSAGGSTSRSCARASSSAPLESFRLRYIENATSTESSARQGAGCVRSSRVFPRPARSALCKREVDAGGVGIEQLAIVGGRCPRTICARDAPKAVHAELLGPARAPAVPSSSASSPAAARRMRSIWKITILAVREAGGEGEIAARSARESSACPLHRARWWPARAAVGAANVAVELRQAGAQRRDRQRVRRAPGANADRER